MGKVDPLRFYRSLAHLSIPVVKWKETMKNWNGLVLFFVNPYKHGRGQKDRGSSGGAVVVAEVTVWTVAPGELRKLPDGMEK